MHRVGFQFLYGVFFHGASRMFRPLPIFIGMRYTRAKRRKSFISFISMTSMIGLALGVLAMIVVLSVMNGFQREMSSRILGMVPHATIESADPITDWRGLAAKVQENPQVLAVAPFTQMQGLLTHDGKVQKVLLNGIDPLEERKVSIIDHFIKQGQLDSLSPGSFGIMIGDKAAAKLGVGIGDKLTFVAPEVTVTPAGMFPRMKRFEVTGIFHVGAGEIDGFLGLTNLDDLGRLHRWKPNQVQGLRLKFDDLFAAPRTSWEIAQKLGENNFYSRDWTRTHGNLYQATMIGLLL
ncbi:LolC/E family lipoprotein releasing system, transmembrane protein, partial [Pseudomonas syringae pv. syringae]